jgi:DNA-binding transcriptional MerR regulator
MQELEAQTGFTGRTIRYYITRGLLSPAHGRGPTATYDQSHLLRLKAIQLRRGRNQPLDEIKDELANLTDEDIAAEMRIETEPPEDRWRRIVLHPDIELHVRERGGERNRRVEDAVKWIVDLARSVVDRLEQGP